MPHPGGAGAYGRVLYETPVVENSFQLEAGKHAELLQIDSLTKDRSPQIRV